MPKEEIFVRKLGSVDRLAPLATTMGDVASLYHKASNNAMERTSFVCQLFFVLARAKRNEVVDGPWTVVHFKSESQSSDRLTISSYLHEAMRLSLFCLC